MRRYLSSMRSFGRVAKLLDVKSKVVMCGLYFLTVATKSAGSSVSSQYLHMQYWLHMIAL
jgi:hypothetical protein